MTATATLSKEQILEMQRSEKGDTLVPVTIMDESGKEPVECQMVWAWVSKERLKKK